MSEANSPIPKITKVNKMSMKALVGKKQSKKVTFMDEEIVIQKLNVANVSSIQALARKVEESDDEMAGMEIMRLVIRTGAEGAEELTDEDFNTFPMDELSALSGAIMLFSGIGQAENTAEKSGN